MRLTANIVLASLLYLMPHVFMSTVSALPGNDVIEIRFEHEHGEAVEHSHNHAQATHSHTHAKPTETVSHHTHPEPHWHSIQFLPALNRLFLKHQQFVAPIALHSFQVHNQHDFSTTAYTPRVRSPKQSLHRSSCVFIV